MGVAPWELAEAPSYWLNLALQFACDEQWQEQELHERWKKQRKPTPR